MRWIALLCAGALLAPVSGGIDVSSLDRGVKPCEDFYRFANGNWLKAHPVPADRATWGRFNELEERNAATIRRILEGAARGGAGGAARLVGDFYGSCMAEEEIEAAGLRPLAEELARIDRIRTRRDLQDEVARLHALNVNALFLVGPKQDARDSSQVILEIWQGGLGLPEGDYYFKEDEKTKGVREEYARHVARTFALAGDAGAEAEREAQAAVRLETRLAEAWMPRVRRRDPKEVYNRKTPAEMRAFTPNFSWERYLKKIGVAARTDINVGQPGFFRRVDELVRAAPLSEWKSYLRWRLVNEEAAALSSKFVAEDFAFKGRVLTGATELEPRWKRCVAATESALGEAVGRLFVEQTFPPAAKSQALALVKNLKAALRSDLESLDWMGEPTRRAALAKLDAFSDKIGYPDRWRDYSSLRLGPRTFALNRMRAAAFDVRRELNKVGRPVDRNEWVLAPQAVDAGYVAATNEVVFPAGVLQPPVFDAAADDAVNYGALGAVIGHEMTHAFDDQGRQYDARGNLSDWWSAEDARNFRARAECVVKQFDAFEVEPGLHTNGQLVVGEAIADLGGVGVAFAAFERSLAGRPRPADADGFTPEQRFFLAWAQMWAENARPEFARLQANTNPHPPARLRVNAPLSNLPAFAAAFGCREGDAMARPAGERCRVW